MRLVKCIKGWGTGMAILFFPVLVFNQNFEFGTQIWKLVIAAFIVFFPVLLFFEFVIRRFVIRNKVGLFILLSAIIILAEIEFAALPIKFTQIKYTPTIVANIGFLFVGIISAFVISNYIFGEKRIVIVQKEIESII